MTDSKTATSSENGNTKEEEAMESAPQIAAVFLWKLGIEYVTTSTGSRMNRVCLGGDSRQNTIRGFQIWMTRWVNVPYEPTLLYLKGLRYTFLVNMLDLKDISVYTVQPKRDDSLVVQAYNLGLPSA